MKECRQGWLRSQAATLDLVYGHPGMRATSWSGTPEPTRRAARKRRQSSIVAIFAGIWRPSCTIAPMASVHWTDCSHPTHSGRRPERQSMHSEAALVGRASLAFGKRTSDHTARSLLRPTGASDGRAQGAGGRRRMMNVLSRSFSILRR